MNYSLILVPITRRDVSCIFNLAKHLAYIIFILFVNLSQVVALDDVYEVEIRLENHIFTPSEIYVPNNTKIKLVIYNADPTIEEFDSSDLKRERILRSKSKTNILLAPLKVGRYDFIGEFYQDTAKGTVIVE